MTDTTTQMQTDEGSKCKKCCKKSRKLWGIFALLAVFGLGFFIGKATSFAPYRAFYGANHHIQGYKMGERRLDLALSAIDATQDQRDKVKSALIKAMIDMPAAKTQMRDLAKDGLDIISQPVIDTSKLEATRQAALKQFEAHSVKHQATLLEIAAILTPEQRQKLKMLAEMRLNAHK